MTAAKMSVTKKLKAKDVGHDEDVKLKDKVITYHFRGVDLGKKKTMIHFEREIMNELKENEEENSTYFMDYPISTNLPPHIDLVNALKALRPFGFELCEMEVEKSTRHSYNIINVKIKGDMELQQSRVEMVMGHTVKRTSKTIKWPTGEVAMYGESDYPKFKELAKCIETLKAECYAMAFEGKFGFEVKDPNQLPIPLFYREEQKEKKEFKTTFTQ